eukprot:TRINITY_DN16717_c0_g1_i1.p1 TRINITY_DN16717_c0_g1~~TRINITY_DN16717_c0_g1_i1.p1  ORF type:complete len:119 (-),score=28.09 TRINITY_DN16717_c0_g1_i1:217-573(-)
MDHQERTSDDELTSSHNEKNDEAKNKNEFSSELAALKVIVPSFKWQYEQSFLQKLNSSSSSVSSSCPYILELLDTLSVDGQPAFLLEYAAGGSLKEKLSEMKSNSNLAFTELQCKKII